MLLSGFSVAFRDFGDMLARLVEGVGWGICDGDGDGVGVFVFWDVIVISAYLLGFGFWILDFGEGSCT